MPQGRTEAWDLHAEVAAADERQHRFLAVVSHRLRTPLTVVLGYAELLADEISGPLTPLQAEHLARMQASGHELLQLLDELFSPRTGQDAQIDRIV